jgi:hypothetical protein
MDQSPAAIKIQIAAFKRTVLNLLDIKAGIEFQVDSICDDFEKAKKKPKMPPDVLQRMERFCDKFTRYTQHQKDFNQLFQMFLDRHLEDASLHADQLEKWSSQVKKQPFATSI